MTSCLRSSSRLYSAQPGFVFSFCDVLRYPAFLLPGLSAAVTAFWRGPASCFPLFASLHRCGLGRLTSAQLILAPYPVSVAQLASDLESRSLVSRPCPFHGALLQPPRSSFAHSFSTTLLCDACRRPQHLRSDPSPALTSCLNLLSLLLPARSRFVGRGLFPPSCLGSPLVYGIITAMTYFAPGAFPLGASELITSLLGVDGLLPCLFCLL